MGNCQGRNSDAADTNRSFHAAATPRHYHTPVPPRHVRRPNGHAFVAPSLLDMKDHTNDDDSNPPRQGAAVLCHVCCENGTETVIPAAKVTSQCSKLRNVCDRCLAHHLREQIRGKGDIFNLPCLCNAGQQCPVKLGFAHVRKYADKEIFEQYDDLLTRRMLESQDEFCWCSANGCGSGQLHASQDSNPIMRCHACAARTCFTHGCPWHQGRTCAEYDRDAGRSDEVALLQLLENSSSTIKKCPQCNQGIEKNSGCNHMTCRCGHQFCWLCLSPYLGPNGIRAIGNSAHQPSCRDYRSN